MHRRGAIVSAEREVVLEHRAKLDLVEAVDRCRRLLPADVHRDVVVLVEVDASRMGLKKLTAIE